MEAHDCNFHDGLGRCINDRCVLHRAMRTLSKNLAMAAALCRSFTLGGKYADDLWDVDMHGRLWRPGCRRSTP